MMSLARRAILAAGLVSVVAAPNGLAAQAGGRGATPRTWTDVLEAMRAAYDRKWYHTLAFAQQTTSCRPDGSTQVQTWYETLRYTLQSGTQLRIDLGDLAAGNGTLSTSDSTFPVRGGMPAPPRGTGNPFLPLIEGVYVQPVSQTVKDLAGMKVDLSRVSTGTWKGQPVWIVGAASATDSTSPQFWVDTERKLLVRMIVRPNESQPPLDVHLAGYVRAGGGWLATKIDFLQGGRPLQVQQYTE